MNPQTPNARPDLIAWSAGGILGVIEAAAIQNPIAWWSLDSDRSIYFYAFLSYGFAFWILLRIMRLFFRLRVPGSLSRVAALLGALVLAASAVYAFVPPYRFMPNTSTNSPRPNIVMITMDTTRADHLGCYGYSRQTSPFLDSLAQRGVLFEQAYATATWTLPSHTSLFTGTMPSVNGVGHNNFFVSPSLVTLAELLKSQGYTTGGFIGGPFLVSAFNIHQGFDYYDEELDPHNKLQRLWLFRAMTFLLRHPFWATDGQRRAGQINSKVFPWIDAVKSRKPFFLFVNYFDPHEPYDPPESAKQEMNVHATITGHIRHYFIDKQTGIALHRDQTPLRQDEFAQLRDLYDGEIRYMDDELSRLFRKLKDADALDNTIVIITSDHGESIGEHGLLDHGHSLYQEQVHVPLIILGPGRWQNPARIDSPVQITDIFATLLDELGEKPAAGIQGRSFLPLLSGSLRSARPILAELDEDPHPRFIAFRRSLRMILKDNQKLIESSNQKHELYDLASDPMELDNRINISNEIAAVLRKEMNDHFRLYIALKHQGNGEIDPETREKLKALGYIE